jgi:putative hemolysin
MTNPCKLPIKPRFLASALEQALGLDRLADIYDGRPNDSTAYEFLDYILSALGVTLTINGSENLLDVPKQGPLLIVSNHPLGGLEGVAIAKVIAEIRPDIQVLTNALLLRIPELTDIFIGVDVLSSNAASGNVAGIKQVHQHLKRGGAVLIFPAGMVSAYEPEFKRVQDRAWSR